MRSCEHMFYTNIRSPVKARILAACSPLRGLAVRPHGASCPAGERGGGYRPPVSAGDRAKGRRCLRSTSVPRRLTAGRTSPALRATGPRGGMPFTAGCWCQYWHLRGKAYDTGWGDANRARLERQVADGEVPGLLAYVDDVPMGWCRLGPRETFERLEHSAKLARVDDEDVWSLVCFSVHVSARGSGIAAALLESAIGHATSYGAPVLEAYPVAQATMSSTRSPATGGRYSRGVRARSGRKQCRGCAPRVRLTRSDAL